MSSYHTRRLNKFTDIKMFINKKKVLLYLDPLYFEDEVVKNKFNQWYQPQKITQIRAVTILTALLYLIYSQINQHIAPPSIQPLMALVQLYFLPIGLLFITAMSYWDKFFRLTNILLAAISILAVIASLLIISKLDNYQIYLPEIYMIVIWTFSISGLRLAYALISASIMFLIASISGFYLFLDNAILFPHLLWLFSAFSFGLLNAFLIEKSNMQTFLINQQLEAIAETDKLTALYNRSKIESVLVEEIERSKRYKRAMSVISVDIDHFKMVNDSFGHHVGDVVLKEFSLILKNKVRKLDFVGRWGGEEFLLILPETSMKEAAKVAEHIRSEVENFIFSIVKQKTASFGVSEYVHGDSAQSIIIRVDKALYEAKDKGRNQIYTI